MGFLRALVAVGLMCLCLPSCAQADDVLPGMNCSVQQAPPPYSAQGRSGVYDYAVRNVAEQEDWLGLLACAKTTTLPQPVAAGTPEMPVVTAKGRTTLILVYSPDGAKLRRMEIFALVNVSGFTPSMKAAQQSFQLSGTLNSPQEDGKGYLDGMTVALSPDPADAFKQVDLRFDVKSEKSWLADGVVKMGFYVESKDCEAPEWKAFCGAVDRLVAASSALHVEFRTKYGAPVASADIPVAGRPEALAIAKEKLAGLPAR